jgi:hypothetical protein
MLVEPIMPKCWHRQVVVDAKDVGEHPHAEGVDDGDVDVDTKDVSKAPHVKVLVEANCCSHRRYRRRYVVGVDVEDV